MHIRTDFVCTLGGSVRRVSLSVLDALRETVPSNCVKTETQYRISLSSLFGSSGAGTAALCPPKPDALCGRGDAWAGNSHLARTFGTPT